MSTNKAVWEPLTCNCKKARCDDCFKCSKCGCRHDGKTPVKKGARKAGQRGLGVKKKRQLEEEKQKRDVNQYRMGGLYESPMVPDNLVLHSSFPSTNPFVRVSEREVPVCTSVTDVLNAFNLANKNDSVRAHLPSVQSRLDVNTWKDIDDQATSFTRNIIRDIMLRVCVIFCGNSEEAGLALWESMDVLPKPDIPASEILTTIAGCYVKMPRGSIEKRVLRACATACSSRRSLQKMSADVDGFSISCDSFRAGSQDLESLKAGLQLHNKPRSICRYQPELIRYTVFTLGI